MHRGPRRTVYPSAVPPTVGKPVFDEPRRDACHIGTEPQSVVERESVDAAIDFATPVGRSSYSQRLFAATSSAVRRSRRTVESMPESRKVLSDQVVAVYGWLPADSSLNSWPAGSRHRRPTARPGPAERAVGRRSPPWRSAPASLPTPAVVRRRGQDPPANAGTGRNRGAPDRDFGHHRLLLDVGSTHWAATHERNSVPPQRVSGYR